MTETPALPRKEASARVAVIMVAAGRGTRLGYGIPKAQVPIAEHSMLETALLSADSFLRRDDVQLVAVLPPERPEFQQLIENFAREHGHHLAVTHGGATRTESVLNGLVLAPDAEFVLVHDAARPLASAALFERVLASLEAGSEATIPGIKVADTIKRISTTAEVAETVNRDELRAIQTPQGFQRVALQEAYVATQSWTDAEREAATDEATLFEMQGRPVQVIEGEQRALKVTTAHDLQVVRFLASEEQ